MRRRGLEPQLLSVDGSNPVVFSQIRTPQATHLRRSASDDKASIVAMTAALDAITLRGCVPARTSGSSSTVRKRMDRPISNACSAPIALFAGDLWLICDGTDVPQSAALDDRRPRHPSGMQGTPMTHHNLMEANND